MMATRIGVLLTLAAADPASKELPQPVAAMLDQAIESGSEAEVEAIAKFARKALPAQEAEIDALLKAYREKLALAASSAASEDTAAATNEKTSDGFFDNWTGEGEIGGFFSGGNSDTAGLAAALQLTRETTRWRVKLNASGDWQRSNGVTSAEQFVGSIEPDYKVNDRLFFYGFAQYERDPFQGYDARYVVSGGVGFRPVARKNFRIDLKVGPAWRHTDYFTVEDTDALTGLGSGNLFWRISPILSFNEAASVLLQSQGSTLTSLTSVDAKLNGSLSARLSYQVRHETNPPAGLKNTDTLSRMTLVYGF
jgi:putative salt-induced outer membrane protein